jgi:hypothetical protein
MGSRRLARLTPRVNPVLRVFLAAKFGVTRVGGTGSAIAQPFPDYDDEADEEPRDGRRNHDEPHKTDGTEHHIAHGDLARDGRLTNGLDDDRARLGTGRRERLWERRRCWSRLLAHDRYRDFTQDPASSASSASVRTATPVAPFG